MLAEVTNWLSDAFLALGYPGVTLLVLVETIFPPLAGPTLPVAGLVAGRGDASLLGMLVASTVGSVLGAWCLYWITLQVGTARIQRLAVRWGGRFGLTDEAFDRAEQWFDRRASAAVLWGRCIPVVRSLVTVPAAARGLPFGRFTILTAIGCALWNGAAITTGAVLGDQVARVGNLVQVVQIAAVGAITVFVARWAWRRRAMRTARAAN